MDARRSFEHRKLHKTTRKHVAQHRCACNRCRDRTHLDLCASLVLWHIKQELSAAQLDRSSGSNVVNSFLAQTRDRLISKRQFAPGLSAGLDGVALANSLVDHHWARRCTGWYHFHVLYHLSNLCFLEV